MCRTFRHEVGATAGAATFLFKLVNADPCQEVDGEMFIGWVTPGEVRNEGENDCGEDVGDTYGLGPFGLIGVPQLNQKNKFMILLHRIAQKSFTLCQVSTSKLCFLLQI
jgi:hypothetical protein